MAYTLRWGIMATGGISQQFVADLLLDPALSRDEHEVTHKIVAVASSSSLDKAKDFVQGLFTDKQAGDTPKTYGNYDDLVKDPDVQIIYVATPQSHHYANVLTCLRAGKHVLCEKPFTINAKQTAHLLSVAKSSNLFLMEAMWTRFMPISHKLRSMLHSDNILGPIKRVFADFSMIVSRPDHRLFNPNLGGGALLDLGIYSLLWPLMVLYEHPDNKDEKTGEFVRPTISASILKTADGKVDEYTSATLVFEKLRAVGYATTSLSARSLRPNCITIQGEKGKITLGGLPPHPTSYQVNLTGQEPTSHDLTFKHNLNGLGWEADECAKCIRDGKLESSIVPHSWTISVMEIMDEIRRQGTYEFPSEIEAME